MPFYDVFHFAATVSGRTIKAYVNQKLVSTQTLGGDIIQPGQADPIYVSDPWHPTNGFQIKDLSVFPAALADSDIAALAGVSSCGNFTGQVPDNCYSVTPAGLKSVSVLGTYGIGPWGGSATFASKTASWIWNVADAAASAPGDVLIKFIYVYVNQTAANIAATVHMMIDNVGTLSVNNTQIG